MPELPAGALEPTVQAPPGPLPVVSPDARPEFRVDVETVGFGIRQDFASGSEKFRGPEFGGTEITPRFVVRPLLGRPILSAEARVRLVRLTASDGTDLLAAGATLAPRPSVNRQYGPRFVFCAADPESTGLAVSYPGVLHPRTPAIAIDRVPAGIGVLEGELTMDVVEEDEIREFTLDRTAKRVEIAPGTTFSFEPGEPWAQATISVDPAGTNGRQPIVNYVRYFAKPGGVTMPREMAVPFRAVPPEDAPVVARAKFSLFPGTGSCGVESHVVLRTRSVTLPFRVENLVLTGAPPASRARPDASVDFQASRDGYVVRLASLAARGSRSTEAEAAPSAGTQQRPIVVLGLDIADAAGGRAFGWFTACRVDAATDDAGAPLYAAPAAAGVPRAGLVVDRWYLPWPELPAKDAPKDDRAEGRRAHVARFPLGALPARFGAIRGTVEFAEVKRDVVREIRLVPGAEPIELAPGVRVIVREQTPDPNVWPSQPKDDWVVVEIKLPAGADRRSDAPSPRLNMVQFIDAAGVAGRPLFTLPDTQSGDRRVYALGQSAFQERAASMLVQVVLETSPREIPFEFHDVPCTER